MVGKRNWETSSSQKQIGQISYEPGFSAKTRYPQHGHGNKGEAVNGGPANGRDQQIAANGLSTPQGATAILLHRLVRPL
jgi:hypothetical protein